MNKKSKEILEKRSKEGRQQPSKSPLKVNTEVKGVQLSAKTESILYSKFVQEWNQAMSKHNKRENSNIDLEKFLMIMNTLGFIKEFKNNSQK